MKYFARRRIDGNFEFGKSMKIVANKFGLSEATIAYKFRLNKKHGKKPHIYHKGIDIFKNVTNVED